jgi:peptidoglycan-associated lipoprotein
MKKILTYSSLALILLFGGCSSKNVIDGGNPDDKLNSMKTNIVDDNNNQGHQMNTIGADYVKNTANDLDDFDGTGNIYFAFDKYNLTTKAKDKLDKNIASFNEMDGNYNIKIEGNCDEWGTDQYNYALGLRRANTVKEYFVAHGVDADKISLVSYGESNPVCNAHNRNCWRKNRRADIKLLP